MKKKLFDHAVSASFIIPAIRNVKALVTVLDHYANPCIMLKIGDINTLPNIVKKAHEKGKNVIVHHDSIGGVGIDRSAIHYLSNIGVDAVSITKPQCISMIKEEKMVAILGLFIIDSSAVISSTRLIKEVDPDYALLMPSFLPEPTITHIREHTKIPLLGGGLCSTNDMASHLSRLGLTAVTSSEDSLWNKNLQEV